MASTQRLHRSWVLDPPPGPGAKSSTSVRLLQWNTLADGLAQNGDFVNVKPEYLEWQHRKPLIVAEISEAQADIVCVQELNFFDEISAALEPLGYKGAFLAKRQSPCVKYNSPADGVAIFWRADRLQPREAPHGFHYTDAAGGLCAQGALTVLLEECGQQGRSLVVATTHLKAKEGAGLDEVRLSQMRQLLRSLSGLLQRASHSCSAGGNGVGHTSSNGASTTPDAQEVRPAALENTPVVIAGDFNATPSSKACKLLAAHPWGFRSVWDAPLQPERESSPCTHPPTPATSSVSSQDEGTCAYQEFSTWKFRSGGESKRIIDHMWFTPGGGLAPQNRWRMLSEDEIGATGLPCAGYPSDHIALCVEFEWPLFGGAVERDGAR